RALAREGAGGGGAAAVTGAAGAQGPGVPARPARGRREAAHHRRPRPEPGQPDTRRQGARDLAEGAGDPAPGGGSHPSSPAMIARLSLASTAPTPDRAPPPRRATARGRARPR